MMIGIRFWNCEMEFGIGDLGQGLGLGFVRAKIKLFHMMIKIRFVGFLFGDWTLGFGMGIGT